MSYTLPQIDLSSTQIGQSVIIDFSAVRNQVAFDPAHASDPAHIRIFNESGSALSIAADSGNLNDYVPAGAWPAYPIDQGASKITCTVVSKLPNPPIQLILPTFYVPGEPVPETPQLGNSPIGIGGTIQTSSVQTLSNEGGTNALVIDIGDATNPNLITIYQDGHALYFVDQSGTKHQVLKMNASGIPLEIGMANDTTQVNSSLNCVQATGLSLQTTNNAKVGGTLESVGAATMDSTLTVTGDATLNGAGTGLAVTNNETVGGTLAVTGATTLTGAVTATNNSNNIQASTLQGGANLPAGRLGIAVDGDTLDANSATATYLKTRSGTGAFIVFQVPGGTEICRVDGTGFIMNGTTLNLGSGGTLKFEGGNTIKDISSFTGTGTGTYNHGLNRTPFWVAPIVNVSGSATQGFDTATSTQVHVTLGASLGFRAFCYG